jgi:hypothetical protein
VSRDSTELAEVWGGPPPARVHAALFVAFFDVLGLAFLLAAVFGFVAAWHAAASFFVTHGAWPWIRGLR